MTNSRFFVSVLVFVGLFLWPIFSQAAVFTNNLKIGSEGPEVKALQIFLNQSSSTQVSLSGPGSPWQETSYFGRKTLLAVRRFQKIYQIFGESYRVGPQTRTKLNEVLDLMVNKNSELKKISTPLSKTIAPIPTVINKTYLNTTENNLSFAVLGGNDWLEIMKVMPPTPPNSPSLKLSSVAPNKGRLNQSVTLKGIFPQNKGITVFTSFNRLDNLVSPDGQSLTFVITGVEGAEASGWPVWIYAYNETGVSNGVVYTLSVD
jgi:peptidoglycan hydrolase-like protein with peptidoglycan-binding domain